jgi:hypothetical protein
MKMSPSKKGLLPIVASFLTSVLAFLAHRPHRPFFDFGKNRNRPTVKFQNFGNRNARFCRLGAKSMAGTGSNRRHGGWGDHLYSAAGRRERFPRPAEGCSCALWAGRTVRKTMVSTPQHNSQFANDYRSESSITVRKNHSSDSSGGSITSMFSGAGKAFGVTPSISLWPSGQTMMRWKVMTFEPPSESEACSVVGSCRYFGDRTSRAMALRCLLDCPVDSWSSPLRPCYH